MASPRAPRKIRLNEQPRLVDGFNRGLNFLLISISEFNMKTTVTKNSGGSENLLRVFGHGSLFLVRKCPND